MREVRGLNPGSARKNFSFNLLRFIPRQSGPMQDKIGWQPWDPGPILTIKAHIPTTLNYILKRKEKIYFIVINEMCLLEDKIKVHIKKICSKAIVDTTMSFFVYTFSPLFRCYPFGMALNFIFIINTFQLSLIIHRHHTEQRCKNLNHLMVSLCLKS